MENVRGNGTKLKFSVSQSGRVLLMYKGSVLFDKEVQSSDETSVENFETYQYSYHCPAHSNAYRACKIGIFSEETNYYYATMYLLPGQIGNGTFTMRATRKPTISFPSYLSVLPNNLYMYRFSSSDIFSFAILEPSSEDFYLLPETHSIAGQFKEEGEYHYTLTIGNEFGNSTISFTMGVSRCPHPTEKFIGFSRLDSHNELESYSIYTSLNELFFTTLNHSIGITGAGFCVEKGGYGNVLIQMNGPSTGWNQRLPIRFFDELGVLGEFQLEKYTFYNQRHFHYLNPLPMASTYRYSYDFVENWMNRKFKDSTWKTGKVGEWGSFKDNHMIYFRRDFSINDLSYYTLLFIDLMFEDVATIYINGHFIAELQPSFVNVTQRFIFPLTSVEENNIIAVALKKNSTVDHSSILFDMSIHLSTTQSIQLSTDGTPYDSQIRPEPDHHVEKAFDNSDYTSWIIRSSPTTLTYKFPPSHKRVVNMVMMRQAKGNRPSVLAIEGVDEMKNSTTRLFTLNSTIFMEKRDYEYLYFDNTVAFNTYTIQFVEFTGRGATELRDIRFMYVSPMTCKKKIGLSEQPLATVLYKDCPITTKGIRAMKCMNVDNKAKWVDDRSACLPKYPKKPMSYIDFSMIVNHIYYEETYPIKNKIVKLITEELVVREKEISIVHLRDLSNNDQYSTHIYLRFTVETLIADYIIYHFNLLIPDFSSLVTKYFGSEYSGHLVDLPVLHNPINWAVVILVSSLIVIAVASLSFYLHVRSKNAQSTKSLKKSLRFGKKHEDNEALLDTTQV